MYFNYNGFDFLHFSNYYMDALHMLTDTTTTCYSCKYKHIHSTQK